MSLRLFGCVCGQFHSPGAGLGMAAERVSVPLPFYVIEHPAGVAVFDTGLHSELANYDDPYRQMLRKQDLDATMEPGQTAREHLQRLDIDPDRVRFAVVSHLHFDHAGGLHQLPNAELVVQRREWECGQDRESAARSFLPRRFFNLGHKLRLVDGEHDLFGDGSVTLMPSYGHTPGHQSMRVRSAQGDFVLVGDACYNCEVERNRSFPDYSDHDQMNRSLDALLALRGEGASLIYGHDPAQWGESALLPDAR